MNIPDIPLLEKIRRVVKSSANSMAKAIVIKVLLEDLESTQETEKEDSERKTPIINDLA